MQMVIDTQSIGGLQNECKVSPGEFVIVRNVVWDRFKRSSV